MIWALLFVATLAKVSLTVDYTPSTNTYLLGLTRVLPILDIVNLFDEPYTVSNAETTPTTNSEPTVDQMMYYNYYAASMYCPYELKNLTCEYCQKFKNDVDNHTVFQNDYHNTLCLVTLSHNRSEIVVAYRGTMNVWNVILDLTLIKTGKGNIKLHLGFYLATRSLYDTVVGIVGLLLESYPTYKIVVCGHSLGAAMARITQYFFHSTEQFPNTKIEVYTYGEPRNGNKAYVDYMNNLEDMTARVVARADIIPHVPPTYPLTLESGENYIHVQIEFWINGKAKQRFCNASTYEDRTCSMSLGPLYSAVDHLIYFDVDVLKCFGGNPVALTSIPFDLPQPPSNIPPLPTHISDFTAALTHTGVSLVSPIFGR